MRIILAGGGGSRLSKPLDRTMAMWMGIDPTMLYLPFALPNDHRLLPSCEAWIASTFAPFGVRKIVTWHEQQGLNPPHPIDVTHFDGVYIGGGNTFRLLDILRRGHLDAMLKRFAAADGPIYGGSAGAIILGADIAHASAFSDQAPPGPFDTSGLDLIRDEAGRPALVLPHFIPGWRQDAQRIADGSQVQVIGIAEDAGAIIEGNRWSTTGSHPVSIVSPG